MATAAPAFDYPEFQRKGQDMVRKLLRSLKSLALWFDHPVEVKLVPDYYTIVKKPMDLGTVNSRLTRKEYSSPSEFFAVRPSRSQLCTS